MNTKYDETYETDQQIIDIPSNTKPFPSNFEITAIGACHDDEKVYKIWVTYGERNSETD